MKPGKERLVKVALPDSWQYGPPFVYSKDPDLVKTETSVLGQIYRDLAEISITHRVPLRQINAYRKKYPGDTKQEAALTLLQTYLVTLQQAEEELRERAYRELAYRPNVISPIADIYRQYYQVVAKMLFPSRQPIAAGSSAVLTDIYELPSQLANFYLTRPRTGFSTLTIEYPRQNLPPHQTANIETKINPNQHLTIRETSSDGRTGQTTQNIFVFGRQRPPVDPHQTELVAEIGDLINGYLAS